MPFTKSVLGEPCPTKCNEGALGLQGLKPNSRLAWTSELKLRPTNRPIRKCVSSGFSQVVKVARWRATETRRGTACRSRRAFSVNRAPDSRLGCGNYEHG